MMKKSIVYLMIAAAVLTGLFVWGGNQSGVYARMGDNVTYTFPYLTTASDKPTYCVVSNMTQDNATVHFYVIADNAMTTSSQAQTTDLAQTSAIVPAFQTRQITIDTLGLWIDSVNTSGSILNSQWGSLSGKVNANTSYGASIRFSQMGAASYQDDITAANVGTTKYGNATSLDWTCGNLPMACFQGTTNPKRNLVGYMCSDEMMHIVQNRYSGTQTSYTRGNALTTVPLQGDLGMPYNKIYTY
ncbi:MAG: hypothetical protein HQK99_14865 [Nitrospirae bacterium]|nr:hypothetical protein [Nitrospirota bacterium]